MIQSVIVLIVIVSAIAYSVYAVFKNIRKKDDTSACGDCNGCDIKREITKNRQASLSKDMSTCTCNRDDK